MRNPYFSFELLSFYYHDGDWGFGILNLERIDELDWWLLYVSNDSRRYQFLGFRLGKYRE